jgi:hypothetical protein
LLKQFSESISTGLGMRIDESDAQFANADLLKERS